MQNDRTACIQLHASIKEHVNALYSIPEEKMGLYAEKMRESQRIDKEIKEREKKLQKELEEMKREYNKLN